MKRFSWKLAICLIPVVVAAFLAARAYLLYQRGEGGFKLGVDLVGGTILVYEVDDPSKLPTNYQPEELAASLKRRIDPTDLYNVTIRPVSNTRVEIILPTGGAHQAAIEEQNWQELLTKIRGRWPKLEGVDLEVGKGRRQDLMLTIQQQLDQAAWNDLLAKAREKWPAIKDAKLDAERGKTADLTAKLVQLKAASEDDAKKFIQENYRTTEFAEIEKFLDENYQTGNRRKDVTQEEVQRIKELIAQVGSLEFRILANTTDDKDAIEQARKDLAEMSKTDEGRKELEKRALLGDAPPRPLHADAETGQRVDTFPVSLGGNTHHYSYSWIEVGRGERQALGLDNASGNDPQRSSNWQTAAEYRKKGEAFVLPMYNTTMLIYSRDSQNRKLPEDERARKKIEYFILTRNPERNPATGEEKAVTGKYLTGAYPDTDQRTLTPSVAFRFDNQGGDLFYELTSLNKPSGSGDGRFQRHLAVILDGQIQSAPSLNEPIRTNGQISGKFTIKEVDRLVSILRAGALPATLKPLPVSENTIGSTLGQDTVDAGTRAVGLAFVAVLIFMVVYYRFAGFVACVALLANLLLTVAFMVAVNATFTLPGLAGLVLMLGMAVDANVLIYERLREERERGASLALAIRNGYDRAFPTIIDTHLSSIFTAIVLYAVGNDQLKGFGVSLTAGLVISLFTSLVMTRLMFDIWLHQGWLHKLSMAKLFSKPNIDFMAIRYYWFTATILLTLFGITVFLVRGKQGLNIDFVGGTAYGGELRPGEARTMAELRQLFKEDRQERLLKVQSVEQLDDEGRSFRITYAQGVPETTQTVTLANPAEGDSKEAHERNIKERAQRLPDWSLEQIFLSKDNEGNRSRFFTVRTEEKEPDLVQVSIDRLLHEEKDGSWASLQKKIELEKVQVDGKTATLWFSDFASPGYVKMLVEREARHQNVRDAQAVELFGEGKSEESRFKEMRLTASSPAVDAGKLKTILDRVRAEFAARPQPQRLENFDSQLALDTQTRAMYAILASWAAILMYLWFRFGNWTFGLAAVLCLAHDLFFTLGIIAFCHYIHEWAPGLASVLLIQDFKIDLPAVAALLTLVGYSVNDTIVVFDRIREVRGKNPALTAQMINDSVNQTLSRTLLTSFITWLVVFVLYLFGGEGVHLFAFVMVVGVVVGTYSSIYIASPLLLIFGEGVVKSPRDRQPAARPEGVTA